jgi:ribosomal protein S1
MEQYCNLLAKIIEKGLCVDINYENEKIMKEDELKAIKKALKKSNEEIKVICENCQYYPL